MKKFICYGLIFTLLIMTGCTINHAEGTKASHSKFTQDDSTTFEESNVEPKGTTSEIDFFKDYTSDIEAEVYAAINASSTLKEEIEMVQKVSDKYTEWAKQAMSQTEMNMSSEWFYTIWDTELNSLWSRFSETADEDTKARVLSAQRCWVSIKDEIVLETLGPSDTGGSIYPCLEYGLLEEMTFNRCNIIANELAKITGEDFQMPERSLYGTYIDNQGTNEGYSYLSTQPGWMHDNEAKISIYRLATLEGTFIEKGNNELVFSTSDGDIKGIIRLNDWNGASFEITESSNSLLSVGEKFEFNFAL